MKSSQIIAFIIIFCATQNVYSLVERDGKICRVQKHGGFDCRLPRNPQELTEVRSEDSYYSKYNSCEFSVMKTWTGEIERFSKRVNISNKLIEIVREKIYWAEQDIKKQDFLPSDKVRYAISTLSVNSEMLAKYEDQLQTQQWCLSCAEMKKNGASDCK